METSDLSDIVKDTIIATQMLIHQISFNQAQVSMYRHPVTDQAIIAAPDYVERKRIADLLYEDTKYIKFKFTNQTYCQLARYHFRCFVGEILVESYGLEHLNIFRTSPRTPLVCKSPPYIYPSHWKQYSNYLLF